MIMIYLKIKLNKVKSLLSNYFKNSLLFEIKKNKYSDIKKIIVKIIANENL